MEYKSGHEGAVGQHLRQLCRLSARTEVQLPQVTKKVSSFKYPLKTLLWAFASLASGYLEIPDKTSAQSTLLCNYIDLTALALSCPLYSQRNKCFLFVAIKQLLSSSVDQQANFHNLYYGYQTNRVVLINTIEESLSFRY